MQLCEQSYEPLNQLRFSHIKAKITDVLTFDIKKTDCQGFVCKVNDQKTIVIRGTEFTNWDDWKTNFNFAKRTTDLGEFHAGFLEDAQSIKEFLMGECLIKNNQFIVLGHSQGAAVAKILALMLCPYYLDYQIGYGEPRSIVANRNSKGWNCFDSTFQALYGVYENCFHRVVHNNDIVTRVPPRVMNFRHFGCLHYLSEDGDYSINPNAWQRFLDRLKGRWEDFGKSGLDGLKDHPPAAYVKALSGICK